LDAIKITKKQVKSFVSGYMEKLELFLLGKMKMISLDMWREDV